MASSVEPRQVLSTAALVIVRAIQAGQAAQHQKENCRRLTDRLKMLLPLLEDIKQATIGNQLAAAATFERLELAAQKSKDLMDRCGHQSSSLYMVTHANAILDQFHEVTSELLRCLTALPLVCLKSSESIRSQVAKINGEFRTVKYSVDSQTKRLASEIELLLMEHRKGVRGNQDILLRLASQLYLQSSEQLKSEQAVLEKARSYAKMKEDKEEENYLSQIMALLSFIESEVCSEKNAAKLVRGGDSAKIKIPKEYCCPLSLEIMADPVILASGQSFERAFIERWLEQGNNSCPVTKHVLSHKSLIPNFALRSSITNWCKSRGLQIPQVKKLPPNATIRGPGVVDFHSWLTNKNEEKVGEGRGGVSLPPLDSKSNLKSKPSLAQGVSRRTVRSVRFISPVDNEPAGAIPEEPPKTPEPVPEEESKETQKLEEASIEVLEEDSKGEEKVMETPEDKGLGRGPLKVEALADSSGSPSSQEGSPEGSGRLRALQGSFSPASMVSDYSVGGSGTPPVEILPVRMNQGSRSPEEYSEKSTLSMPRSVSDSRLREVDNLETEASTLAESSLLLRRSPYRIPEDAEAPMNFGSFPASPASSYSVGSGSGRFSESPSPARAFGSSRVESEVSSASSFLPEAELQELRVLSRNLALGSSQDKHLAAIRVRQLAKGSEDARRAMGKEGAIEPLIRLLESSENILVESALFALMNLSISDANKEEMVSRGIVPLLVRLLRSPSEVSKEGAVGVIFSLSAINEYKLIIGSEGAIPGLVDVLVMGTKRAKCDVICAMYNLSLMGPNKLHLVQHGVVKPIVYIARKGVSVFGGTMVEKSVAVLSNLAWIPEGQNAIVRAKSIPVLCFLVENGTERAKEHSVACLLRLSVDSAVYKNLIYKEDVIAPLMLLSKYGSQRAKVKAKALLQQFNTHSQQNSVQ